MSKQFYTADKPTNCRYCYYWKNRKAGCSLGKENCIYESITPKEQLSECVGCPYGRATPCIGWCTKKLLKEQRER